MYNKMAKQKITNFKIKMKIEHKNLNQNEQLVKMTKKLNKMTEIK